MSQQINLANPLLLKKRYVFGLREMLVVLGVVLFGALAWAGILHYQAVGLEVQAIQEEAAQASAQAVLDELNAKALRVVNPQLSAKIKNTQLQVTQREALLEAIGGTIEKTSVGFSPRLRALALSSTEGVWLNSFNLSADYVQLKGATFNAGMLANYMTQLGKQPPFAGMKFSGMTAVVANVAPASPSADGQPAAPALPQYLDFELTAGRSADSPDQENSDAR